MITDRNWKRVFEGDGPLSTFSAKISMGIVLGLVVGDMEHDLAILKAIRNKFAHCLAPQSLTEVPHSSRCNSLRMKTFVKPEILAAASSKERQRFLESTVANLMCLIVVLQRGIVERMLIAKHVEEIEQKSREGLEKVMRGELVVDSSAT